MRSTRLMGNVPLQTNGNGSPARGRCCTYTRGKRGDKLISRLNATDARKCCNTWNNVTNYSIGSLTYYIDHSSLHYNVKSSFVIQLTKF